LELEIEAIRTAVAENEPQYPLGNPPPERLFGFNTYFKGALLVHALRQEIGDEAFFAGLRAYFQRYGGATASDAEFQAVMEEAAGQSLDTFFAEWLN
jgi:aminopeptidase N